MDIVEKYYIVSYVFKINKFVVSDIYFYETSYIEYGVGVL